MRHRASHCVGLTASVSLERRCAHAAGLSALDACVVWRAREPRCSLVRSSKWLARAGDFAAANFAAIYAPHSFLLRAFLEGASFAALTDEPLLATSCLRR